MNSAEGSAQHQHVVEIVELRRVAPSTQKKSKLKSLEGMQGGALIIHHRRHHGNFCVLQLQTEAVLLQYLCFAPALRAIKFCDQWRAVFNANLVHPVLVTVQRQQSGVAEIPGRLHRIDNHIRG